MSEELSLTLFAGALFAIIALYITYLSSGTKMSFLVFEFFHLLLFSILFISAFECFLPFRLWLARITEIDGYTSSSSLYSFVIGVAMCNLSLTLLNESPRSSAIAIFLSFFSLALILGTFLLCIKVGPSIFGKPIRDINTLLRILLFLLPIAADLAIYTFVVKILNGIFDFFNPISEDEVSK